MRILFILCFVMLVASTAFALGETEITFETLNYQLRSAEDIERWMQDNLQYREFANDGVDDKWAMLKTGIADCDDYTQLAYELLRRKFYRPEIITLSGYSRNGHLICLYWDGGWKFFSNDTIIDASRAKTYQDIGRAYNLEWSTIVVYDSFGKVKHRINRRSNPIRLGE